MTVSEIDGTVVVTADVPPPPETLLAALEAATPGARRILVLTGGDPKEIRHATRWLGQIVDAVVVLPPATTGERRRLAALTLQTALR